MGVTGTEAVVASVCTRTDSFRDVRNSKWLGQVEEEDVLRLPSTLRPLAFPKAHLCPTLCVSLPHHFLLEKTPKRDEAKKKDEKRIANQILQQQLELELEKKDDEEEKSEDEKDKTKDKEGEDDDEAEEPEEYDEEEHEEDVAPGDRLRGCWPR
ncbi:hypothetical protein LUU34_01162500 [Aix galericulata]|nr:hypothetical protein LUU34_01162500 [Aix galericulata]